MLCDSFKARTPDRKPIDWTKSHKVGYLAVKTKNTRHTTGRARAELVYSVG